MSPRCNSWITHLILCLLFYGGMVDLWNCSTIDKSSALRLRAKCGRDVPSRKESFLTQSRSWREVNGLAAREWKIKASTWIMTGIGSFSFPVWLHSPGKWISNVKYANSPRFLIWINTKLMTYMEIFFHDFGNIWFTVAWPSIQKLIKHNPVYFNP